MSRIVLAFGVALVATSLAAPADAGLIDSPLPILPSTGKQAKLVYSTTGVINFADAEATCFTCTNIDKVDVEIGVQIFDFDTTLVNDVTASNGTVVVSSGNTRTICTQLTGSTPRTRP
jgi:hypothetical protein